MEIIVDQKPDILGELIDALEQENFSKVSYMLEQEHPADIAQLLQSIPQKPRLSVWDLIPGDRKGLILMEMNEDAAEFLIEETEAPELITAINQLDPDDQAYMLSITPDDDAAIILGSLDQQNRSLLERSLAFPENQAGRMMDTDFVAIRPEVTAEAVLRFLRRQDTIPPHTDLIMVVNVRYKLIGVLPVNTLLLAQPNDKVADLMQSEFDSVVTIDELDDVARLIESHDLVSVPVVNKEGRLVGRITVDDVVDYIQERSDKQLMSLAGLDEDDDLFEPVKQSVLSRLPWLGVNLATALISATVISLFSPTLEQIVALAILMPVVASMGGIAGSQTLTLAIRGLALGHLQKSNAKLLISKEVGVGMANGAMWSIVIGIIALIWFGSWSLGCVIAIAIFINMTIAGLAGSIIPLILDRFNIDPALAAPMFLTTVTDVIGFMTFLGLATAFLLQ